QDNDGNVAVYPATGADGLMLDPPGALTPPTAPSQYTLLYTLAGTYPVGDGQALNAGFNTLSAAIAAYNVGCVVGAVVFELTDADYSVNESFPVTITQNIAASAVNTLTVRPAAGIAATVSGSVNGSLVELDGADHVTIDGVDAGGSSLTLSNASTGRSAPTVRFINEDGMATWRNATLRGSGLGASRGVVAMGTASSQGNDSLYISDNVIGPVGTSYPPVGIYSAGTNSLAGA